jgi:ATP-binding cassette subfamily F protein 3
MLLTLRNVVRQFDAGPVLDRVSFELREAERVGLVGPNGAGKTTLMRILAGSDQPDEGEIRCAAGLRAGLLEQQSRCASRGTLLDEARLGLAPLYALQREAEVLSQQIARAAPEEAARLHRRFDTVQHELERARAFNIDHRVDQVLLGLGFTRRQYDLPVDRLSGGQISRLLLARLLLSEPDLLLLDEPTNHLDVDATAWLEEFLVGCGRAMLVVSHDRYFLDKVTTRTLELTEGQIESFPGNFTQYWRLKNESAAVRERAWEKQQAFVEKTADFIRRNHYGQRHAQAHDREKKLARLELVERPREITAPPMRFGSAHRTADCVVEALALCKGFDRPLFAGVTLRVMRGDRLGIFGPNGCGKTTLLRTLLGQTSPDGGSVRLGANVVAAYYDQQLESIDPGLEVIEAVRPANQPQLPPAVLRDWLARFGLRGDLVFQKVASLSGGEKSKAALARVALAGANLLVLDEPTNHLDIWSRMALEESLGGFEGTLILVSHDRYFLDRVATQLLVFEPGGCRLFLGNYSQYADSLARSAQQDLAAAAERNPGAAPRQQAAAPRRRRKYPYRKVEDLEGEIAQAEAQLARVERELADPQTHRDGEKARAAARNHQMLQEQLAQLYAHWEEASELN